MGGGVLMNDEKYREIRKSLLGYIAHIAKQNEQSSKEIAETIGFTQINVERLFAGKYNPSLEIFIKLAEAVDVQIKITPKL